MKCVVIFALLAVWISSSDATRCQDIASCTPDMSGLNTASGSQEDIKRMCKVVKDTMTCFNSALADCSQNENVPKSTIEQLQQQMKTYSTMLEGQCSAYEDGGDSHQGGGEGDDGNGSKGSSGADALKMPALILAFFLAIFSFVL